MGLVRVDQSHDDLIHGQLATRDQLPLHRRCGGPLALLTHPVVNDAVMRRPEIEILEIRFMLGEGADRLIVSSLLGGQFQLRFLQPFAERSLAGTPVDSLKLESGLQTLVLTRDRGRENSTDALLGLLEHPGVFIDTVLGSLQDDFLGFLGQVIPLIHFLELIQLFRRVGEIIFCRADILFGVLLPHRSTDIFKVSQVFLGVLLRLPYIGERNRRRLLQLFQFLDRRGQLQFLQRHRCFQLLDLFFQLLAIEIDEQVPFFHHRSVRNHLDDRKIGPALEMGGNRSLLRRLDDTRDLGLHRKLARSDFVQGFLRLRFLGRRFLCSRRFFLFRSLFFCRFLFHRLGLFLLLGGGLLGRLGLFLARLLSVDKRSRGEEANRENPE